MEQIVIREMVATDRPFVATSWAQSFRERSSFAKEIPRSIYFEYQPKVIDFILDRPTTFGIVATNSEDSDLVVGYLILESTEKFKIAHYIYIKRAFNGLGLSKTIIGASPFPIDRGVYASHMTGRGKILIDKYNLIYNPYFV